MNKVFLSNNNSKSSITIASWIKLIIILLLSIILLSLVVFFCHIRTVIQPQRWPPIDFHKKETNIDPLLSFWEQVICFVLLPLVFYLLRFQCATVIHTAIIVNKRRTTMIYCLLTITFTSVLYHTILKPLIFPPPCSGRWIQTDVGYIHGHDRWGHNMNVICGGKQWEPHVINAINDYVHGQGRAIDVGAFIGYHTIRLAKKSAPYKVYAVEGRLDDELYKNMQRNNIRNVHIMNEKIDSTWKLSKDTEADMLDETNGEVVFIKIDCEGCELYFLDAIKATLIQQYQPVMIIEIQDDETRQNARLGGQQMIQPGGTRNDVLKLLRDELQYTVMPLLDGDGLPTWDYLALPREKTRSN